MEGKGPDRQKRVVRSTGLALVLLTCAAFFTLDGKDVSVLQGVRDTLLNMKTMFLMPRMSHFGFGEALRQVGVTLGLAFLTTLFGASLALLFGLLSAKNLTSKRASAVIKGCAAFIRAVPTVLWVLIFACHRRNIIDPGAPKRK